MNSKSEKILHAFLGGKARSRTVKLFLHHPNLSINIEGISKRIGAKERECAGMIKDLLCIGFLSAVKQNNGKTKKNKTR